MKYYFEVTNFFKWAKILFRIQNTPFAASTPFILTHTLAGQTKQGYFRTDLFENRRVVMNEWADFCLGIMN
jgi:hypothetical protein